MILFDQGIILAKTYVIILPLSFGIRLMPHCFTFIGIMCPECYCLNFLKFFFWAIYFLSVWLKFSFTLKYLISCTHFDVKVFASSLNFWPVNYTEMWYWFSACLRIPLEDRFQVVFHCGQRIYSPSSWPSDFIEIHVMA